MEMTRCHSSEVTPITVPCQICRGILIPHQQVVSTPTVVKFFPCVLYRLRTGASLSIHPKFNRRPQPQVISQAPYPTTFCSPTLGLR
jgi:hypothetical protein